MGWAVEHNTGIAGSVTRLVWFKGDLYAFTMNDGIWRRPAAGPPWVQVFAFPTGGQAWVWEDDDAIYCGGGWLNGNNIYRSEDGTAWVVDVDLNVAFGLQASYHDYSEIGGYGSYLYLANHDVAGPGSTFFYRRDLAGVWAAFGAPHVGVEGAGGRGIIGYGGEVYWTNWTNARYWDGAAWSIETTLNSQGCEKMSVIDEILYLNASTIMPWIGGYYWKTAAATDWTWMNLPVPNNMWTCWPLCEGADNETYTATSDGTAMRVYQQVGGMLNLIGYQAVMPVAPDSHGGVCVDDTGAMYIGTEPGAAIQFLAFAGVYTVTPGGLYPQAIDCDGDGDQLYLALYDTGTALPMLISVPIPLDGALSMGSNMFSPAVGTRINVQCSVVGDNLAIAGDFAAVDDHVRVSGDAGLTWTNIGSNLWNVNVAQPLEINPNSLGGTPVAPDEVMVCLNTRAPTSATLRVHWPSCRTGTS